MASIVSARNTKNESDIEWLPPSNPMRARRPARETDLSVHPIHAPAMVGETAGNLVAIQQHESRNARCGCRVVPIGADARTELKRAWLTGCGGSPIDGARQDGLVIGAYRTPVVRRPRP